MEKKTKKNRKVNNVYRKATLIFIMIFAIAIFLVIFQLKSVIKKKNSLPARTPMISKNDTSIEQIEKESIKKINEGISFDTFVDKVYTENEILNFSNEKIKEIRQYQIDKKNTSELLIQKIVGSASSENAAIRRATQAYSNVADQKVNSSKVVLETDYYYIVKVEWDYITETTSKRYNQQVLVFKEFYYDINAKILNMDDIDKVKDILDLKYYVETYSNTGKNIIQSFITQNGEKTEYVIYYFEVEYGNEGSSNKVYLVSETLQIDSATGLIDNVKKERLSSGVRI